MCPARGMTWDGEDDLVAIELTCDKVRGHSGLHHDPHHGPWRE